MSSQAEATSEFWSFLLFGAILFSFVVLVLVLSNWIRKRKQRRIQKSMSQEELRAHADAMRRERAGDESARTWVNTVNMVDHSGPSS